jgi:hypothetical protein
MEIIIHTRQGEKIAEIVSDVVLINTPQDALDLMYDPGMDGARKIILRRENINPAFFELETGLAGEVVQKFVNYGVQLAIVGDFSSETRPSIQAFMRESNRGTHLFFLENTEAAIGMLAQR